MGLLMAPCQDFQHNTFCMCRTSHASVRFKAHGGGLRMKEKKPRQSRGLEVYSHFNPDPKGFQNTEDSQSVLALITRTF